MFTFLHFQRFCWSAEASDTQYKTLEPIVAFKIALLKFVSTNLIRNAILYFTVLDQGWSVGNTNYGS